MMDVPPGVMGFSTKPVHAIYFDFRSRINSFEYPHFRITLRWLPQFYYFKGHEYRLNGPVHGFEAKSVNFQLFLFKLEITNWVIGGNNTVATAQILQFIDKTRDRNPF